MVAGRRRVWTALPYLLVALLGVAVFSGALAYYFGQDDFAGLARARGVIPRLVGPWRYLSHQLYFDLMRPFGLEAVPYHVVSLLLHATTSALVVRLLIARVSPAAAFVGGALFATHPAHYTALYAVAVTGEIMAACFALAAILAARRDDRRRWAAVPLFALSLLGKESTILLPLVVAADRAFDRSPDRPASAIASDPVVLALGATAVLYAASFVLGNAFAIRSGLPERAPYAIAFGWHVLANLLTYAGWALNFLVVTVASVADAASRPFEIVGAVAILAWAAGLASRALRARGWVVAGLAFAAFLLPVLPLPHHTYRYYLYAPMIGVAWCAAAAFDAAFVRRASAGRGAPRRAAGLLPAAVAGALAIVLAVNGRALVHKVETHPFSIPELRADPTVDRAIIARNVRDGLNQWLPADAQALCFWSPVVDRSAETAAAGAPERLSYYEENVRNAVLGGVGVRVMFPRVRRVEFVRGFRGADDSTLYAVYVPDGRLRVETAARLDSLLGALGR